MTMTMGAWTPPANTRVFSTCLLLKLALICHPYFLLELVRATRETSSSCSPITTSSYQPSSSRGLEEGRWIAEEEFHGASSLLSTSSSERLKLKKKEKKPKNYPIRINGHGRLENHPSWWDDDDEEEMDHDCQHKSSGSISGIGVDHDDEDEKDNVQCKKIATLPQKSRSTIKNASSPRRKGLRLRIWKKNSQAIHHEASSSNTTNNHSKEELQSMEGSIKPTIQPTSLSSEYDEEHPMRTDEWLLNIRLSRLYPIEEGDYFPECNNFIKEGGSRRAKRQVMQFARNGYVKVVEDDERRISSSSRDSSNDYDKTTHGGIKRKYKPRVGKWRIGHSGVAFDIPMQMEVGPNRTCGVVGKQSQQLLPSIHAGGGGSGDCSEDKSLSRVRTMTSTTTVLHYHADIHLNKFGERPRMFKGVITRDRHSSFLPPNFLRPVIGTFSAEGIGHDTADTSYRDRAISLSRQQVINEAKGVRLS